MYRPPKRGRSGIPTLLVLALAAAAPTACEQPADPAPEGGASGEAGEAVPPPAPEAPPPPSPEEVVARLDRGLDLSGHSGEVDWQALAGQGHGFAIIKATEGVDLLDPAFHDHWPQIDRVGLVRGAYHFYVTEDDPGEQARFYIDNVTLEPGDLAPVADIELIGHGTEPGLPERFRTFLGILERHYGVEPIVYTGWKFWNAHLGEGFGDHPLWVAEYGVDEPVLPAGWDDWHLWQFQGDAEVPGVEKGVDLSRANRSGVDLTKLVVPH